MRLWKTRSLGCLVALAWTVCHQGLAAQAIEPEIHKAFEEARALLPEPLRDRVEDVTLVRAPDLGVPPDAPFAYQLLNKAAFMAFSIGPRQLMVFDAGVAGRPLWGQAPPSATELVPFLAVVSDVLEVDAPRHEEDPAFLEAWQAFVARVYSWRQEPPPEPVPPPGDSGVLDRFLEDGVRRSMGGSVPLVPLFVHEFGHAIQLDGTSGMATRMATWASNPGFAPRVCQMEATAGSSSPRHATTPKPWPCPKRADC